ncbi:MAG: antibiotic biosynthesis monooxygenase family protein [Novosphingobium sp.]
MVTEIATITVAEGNEAAFAAAMDDVGGPALRACPGLLVLRYGRGVENPVKFALVIEWESIEAHNAVRTNEEFKRFRAAIAPYAVGGTMEHFTLG